MLNSKRNQGRYGHRGCWCCAPRLSKRAIKNREAKVWKNEAVDAIEFSDEQFFEHLMEEGTYDY